jgi:uncharacterized iron-regulated membrane protein
MVFPLFLTVMTGLLFQGAVAAEQADQFLWLLDLHRGKFGRINLETIYPFLNGLGLLSMVATGLVLWWQSRLMRRKSMSR